METDVTVPRDPFEVRARARPYIALGLIFGFILAMTTWLTSLPGGDWRVPAVAAAALFLTMLHLATIRLKYSDGELSYRTLFTGTRSVPLSDIESAETKLVSSAKGSYRVLLLHLRRETEQRPISINTSLFSKEDLGDVFDLLGSKFKGSRTIGVYTDETV